MQGSPFHIDADRRGSSARLTLAGELDLASAPHVEEAAEELIAGGLERLVIDLSGLRFIDSSGLRTIVVLHQRATEQGWSLELISPPEQVLKVFRISGLEDRLRFTDG